MSWIQKDPPEEDGDEFLRPTPDTEADRILLVAGCGLLMGLIGVGTDAPWGWPATALGGAGMLCSLWVQIRKGLSLSHGAFWASRWDALYLFLFILIGGALSIAAHVAFPGSLTVRKVLMPYVFPPLIIGSYALWRHRRARGRR